MRRVRNAQTSHAVGVPPFLNETNSIIFARFLLVTDRKVPLKRFWASIGVISTDFTVEIHVQSVQFVQPVGNGLKRDGGFFDPWTQNSVEFTLPSQPKGKFFGL